MTTERNAPCPCGSGKKHKKCCGITTVRTDDSIEINRLIAYRGQIGRRRKQFCEEYAPKKRAAIVALEAYLQRSLADHAHTSPCSRGCSHCCRLFVAASLQECEIIVNYLYDHEEKLAHFLRTYDTWRSRITRITRCFRQINDLHQKITAREDTAEDRQRFEEECGRYVQADIPCPFLKDSACSIYEVRPYVCAAVVAVSPSEWCAANHPRHAEASYLKSSIQTDDRPAYLTLPAERDVLAPMPSLIYNLLHDGYALLDTVPGLEGIKNAALGDPEVQTILSSRHSFPG